MPEPELILFSYGELAELMVRKLGLKEGLWGVYVKFGINAANAGPSPEELKPTALVQMLEFGLQRMPEPTNLGIDASKLNSASRGGTKRTARKAKRAPKSKK